MVRSAKQLFAAMHCAAAMYYVRTKPPQTVNQLVSPLPKPQVSRQYPRCNEGERVRRMGQILCGTHRVQNGLVRDGQLVSRPDGSIQVRRPY